MPIFTTEARTLRFVPSPQTTQTLSYRCTEFNCGGRRQVHQRNADIAPSASINRWIVSILMFQFDLVHVPGTHHGPDGLSRRRPQPGDKEEPEDDFEDWIDNVNGFIHIINPLPRNFSTITNAPPVTCFITEEDRQESPTPETDEHNTNITENTEETDNSPSYNIVPRSEAAIKADDRLLKIKPWLETLERPDNFT